MAVITEVTWPPGTDFTVTRAKAATMEDLQTAPIEVTIDPSTGIITGRRSWVDLQAAENWILFVETLNPLTATIIS